MIRQKARAHERLVAFLRGELAPTRERVRAFLRTEAGLLVASFVLITFKPTNGYWTIVYLLLVSNPVVGNSATNAVARFFASVVGCAAAFFCIIVGYDEPWLFIPLMALGAGLSLFISRSTPIGPVAVTGGTTFAIITGSIVGAEGPAELITFGFYRILQAVIGGTIGAVAQRFFWPDDPLVLMRESLASQLDAVEARLAGRPAPLDPARVVRHFELLANAEVQHRGLGRRRSEIISLILDVGCIVDETVRVTSAGAPAAHEIVVAARLARRRVADAELFAAPPPLPPAPRVPWRVTLRETRVASRRSVLKLALSAFFAIIVTQILRYPASAALFMALTVSLQVSSGTDISKSLLTVAGIGVGLAAMMLIVVPHMPNVDDAGNFLLLAAAAFAPTAWISVGGPRVRNAGLIGTVVVAYQLLQGDYRPVVDLQATTIFGLSLAIGALLVGAVDRLVWPVDARGGMLHRLVLMMRDTAAFYRERDAHVVVDPNVGTRWRIHRDVVGLVQLRGERAPLVGTPWFAPEEEALHLAAATQRLVAARIVAARRELLGGGPVPSEAEREAIAVRLEADAADVARRYGLAASESS